MPRDLQGSGRHDAPGTYGCLYLSEEPVAAVSEMLAPFRGTGDLDPALLVRSGHPLALAALEMDDGAQLVDLDDPSTLSVERLHPSRVASGRRERTQAYAVDLYERHPRAAGLRWWSTLESSWLHVTVFDRALRSLQEEAVRVLSADDEVVQAAAQYLGLV